MYKIILGPPTERFLKKCDREFYKRLLHRIRELGLHPFPSDVKRVVSKTKVKTFRVRLGEHRILYVVFEKEKEILITDIDKRSKVY